MQGEGEALQTRDPKEKQHVMCLRLVPSAGIPALPLLGGLSKVLWVPLDLQEVFLPFLGLFL